MVETSKTTGDRSLLKNKKEQAQFLHACLQEIDRLCKPLNRKERELSISYSRPSKNDLPISIYFSGLGPSENSIQIQKLRFIAYLYDGVSTIYHAKDEEQVNLKSIFDQAKTSMKREYNIDTDLLLGTHRATHIPSFFNRTRTPKILSFLNRYGLVRLGNSQAEKAPITTPTHVLDTEDKKEAFLKDCFSQIKRIAGKQIKPQSSGLQELYISTGEPPFLYLNNLNPQKLDGDELLKWKKLSFLCFVYNQVQASSRQFSSLNLLDAYYKAHARNTEIFGYLPNDYMNQHRNQESGAMGWIKRYSSPKSANFLQKYGYNLRKNPHRLKGSIEQEQFLSDCLAEIDRILEPLNSKKKNASSYFKISRLKTVDSVIFKNLNLANDEDEEEKPPPGTPQENKLRLLAQLYNRVLDAVNEVVEDIDLKSLYLEEKNLIEKKYGISDLESQLKQHRSTGWRSLGHFRPTKTEAFLQRYQLLGSDSAPEQPGQSSAPSQ